MSLFKNMHRSLPGLLSGFGLQHPSSQGEPERTPHKRVRTPTLLQMEAVECGAAALGTVLSYHEKLIPLEELRTSCGVSRDGSKASNVVKAARRYGLVAKGFKKEPEDLRFLSVPMIVHWNFNHFVVLEGFRKGKAYLNDPATGPRAVSEEEFDQSFTGVVLTFEPGPDFEKGGERRSLVQALKKRLAGSHVGLAYIVLAGLALVVPGLIIPTLSKVFVDDVLVHGLLGWVGPLLLAMGFTAVVYAGLTWLRQAYLLRMEMKLALSMSSKFFWHVLRLPVVFFTQRSSGDINSRVRINDRVARLLSGDLATTVLNVVVIVFYAALMIQYDVLLTLIVVATAALNFGALKYVSRRRTDLNQRLLQEHGKMVGAAMGGLQTIETLKATGSESDFFTRWAGHHAKVLNAQQNLGEYTQLLMVVPPFLLATSAGLVLGIGGMRIISGVLSIGMLIAFQVLMLNFITPVNQMVGLGSTLQDVEGDMKRLDDVLRHETDTELLVDVPEKADDEKEAPAAKLSGHLELENVSFGYSPLEPPLISDFDLTLRPGARVALVGGSGSGKSTVAKLVCGLYKPWEGEILFDGTPREHISRSTMTNSFTVVDQEIFLFEGTIRDNLSLWDATLPEGDLIQAAKDACIHEEITARPEGYDAEIEEGGRNFSGGQRQRLEIARTLAANPTLMVLDEATSALDPTTEKKIDDNLRRRGCTCLIIAHRLSTIRDCDEIIVLDQGAVVQRGTHEELLKKTEGAYVRLLDAM